METYRQHYDKKYMKMAMLQHEETFKQQVHELHRLYQIQKLLMRDMKNAETKRQSASANTQNNPEKSAENEAGSDKSSYSYFEQRKPSRMLDLELPAEEHTEEDNGDVMLVVDEESDLELTLAIGSTQSQRRKQETSITSDSGTSFSSSSTESSDPKLNSNGWRLPQASDVASRCQSESRNGWLYQCLSLNLT
ncbi:uncharacterized protein [Typha latifolia]|uniref:uncharacterized protein n=1 Tax=Typha latifolia TaxID=4733 RepID=UPI003C2D4E02